MASAATETPIFRAPVMRGKPDTTPAAQRNSRIAQPIQSPSGATENSPGQTNIVSAALGNPPPKIIPPLLHSEWRRGMGRGGIAGKSRQNQVVCPGPKGAVATLPLHFPRPKKAHYPGVAQTLHFRSMRPKYHIHDIAQILFVCDPLHGFRGEFNEGTKMRPQPGEQFGARGGFSLIITSPMIGWHSSGAHFKKATKPADAKMGPRLYADLNTPNVEPHENSVKSD